MPGLLLAHTRALAITSWQPWLPVSLTYESDLASPRTILGKTRGQGDVPVLSDNSRFCPSELTAQRVQQSHRELYCRVGRLWQTQTRSKR